MIRVLVVDDHPTIRAGVRDVLRPVADIEIIAEAPTVADAIACVALAIPDVALVDLQLPDADGVEFVRELSASHPEIGCLIFSAHNDPQRIADAAGAGAKGWLLKGATSEQLMTAIRAIAAGREFFPDDLTDRLVHELQKPPAQTVRLTADDERTLELLGKGLSNSEIADELQATDKAIRNRISRLLKKIGVRDRTQAALYAQRRRLGRDDS